MLMQQFKFEDFTSVYHEDGDLAVAYIVDGEGKVVDTFYHRILSGETWTHSGKTLDVYGLQY